MIVGMIATLLLYLGANIYLFIRFWQALSTAPSVVRVAFATLFWLSALALFISLAMRHHSGVEPLQRILFAIGSTWLVFVLYMTLSTIVVDILHLVFPTFRYGLWYALGVTLLLLVGGWVNYRNPRIETIDIESDKLSKSMRIVAISDVHLGYGTTRPMLERYVETINSLEPDVLVIVGDLIDNSIHPVKKASMGEVLGRLRAPKGIYMALGNHEYISGVEECIDYLSSTPVQVLRDSVVQLNSVAIIGRDDRMNRRRKSVDELITKVHEGSFTLLLDHQPYDIATSERLGLDIHISGHTHRGQVWPLNWLTDAIYEQSHGYRKWGATHAYVMQGLSLWGPPFRIGTRSEIVVFNLATARN